DGVPVSLVDAINGIAAGGGCELALACHLRIGAQDALFNLAEIKLGLLPAYGGTQRLPRDIAVARALEMMLAGKSIEANRALELGLLNRVVDPGRLLGEALALP